MADWLSTVYNMADRARHLAGELTESIVAQVDAAQNDIAEEQRKLRKDKAIPSISNMLPWESDSENCTDDLKFRILNLSKNDSNFMVSPPIDVPFVLEEFAPIIMRMLEIDPDLPRIHAKLSPKMDEELFWRNYYIRIKYLRGIFGIDGVSAQSHFRKIIEDDIIFKADIDGPSSLTPLPSSKSASEIPSLDQTDIELKLTAEEELQAEVEFIYVIIILYF